MAQQKAFDVWIVETNTVYSQVPYAVITDWLQEGRLLGEDKLRSPGGQKWVPIHQIAPLAVYLPRVEPHRAEDRAEALEPVQLDFGWRRRREGEDDDVDMIPLIDVSLVLLVFFMMTATVATAPSSINTPEAAHQTLTIDPLMYWVGINRGPEGELIYSFGKGEEKGETFDKREQMLASLRQAIQKEDRRINIRIRGDRRLSFEEVILPTIVDLERFKAGGKVDQVWAEVKDKKR